MRFISDDPIGLAGGINVYAYAGNDPVNLRDSSGLKVICGERWDQETREYFPACTGLDPILVNVEREFDFDAWWAGLNFHEQGPTRPDDFCNVYTDAPVTQFFCQRSFNPGGSGPRRTCAAECLAADYLRRVEQAGGPLSRLQMVDYLVPGHVQCYGACKFNLFDFLVGMWTGSGRTASTWVDPLRPMARDALFVGSRR
jgi:hypothetical protein